MKNVKNYSKLLIFLFFLFMCFSLSFANEKPKKEVRVGWLEVTGTITKENYENISGYAKLYLDQIAQYTNWELVFVKGTFADLYPKLLTGEIDIIPAFGYSEERAQLVHFPNLVMSYAYTTLYVRKDSPLSEHNLSLLNKITVGAISPDELNKINLDKFAKENKLHFNYEYFESYDDINKAVLGGFVDAGIEPNHKDDDATKTVLQFAPRSGYLACTPADPTIVADVNFAQEKLLEVNPNYLNDFLTRFHPRTIPIEFVLSLEEQIHIQNSKPLKVLVGNRWQPYEFYNSISKTFSGYVVDLFNKVSELTGLEFEFVFDKDDCGSFHIMALGEHNIVEANKRGFKITEPYLSLPFTLIYKTLPKFENGNTALVEGILYDYRDFKGFSNWTSVFYENANACLEAVRQGKVNQTILDSFTANYEIERKRKFSKLSVQIMDESFEFCSWVCSDVDPVLFHVLNKSLFYASTKSSNFFLLQNAYKSNEIGLESIINQMPLDIILLFVTLFFILAIVFILYRTKNAKEKLEIKKNIQLQDALMSAEKANTAKTNFTSRISHEIRSPLNAIIGYMSLMKVEEKTANAQVYLNKAEAAGQQLLSLLNDVLDMSRIESGKIQISKNEFNIEDVLETLGTLFNNQAKLAGLEFVVCMENISNKKLFGDQLRLTQILTNLLSNAIKFTPQGGKVQFSIKEEQIHDNIIYLQFSVKDTGLGIEANFLKKIFSPYERQTIQNNSKILGTGLGLAITKNLVNLLDGTINVQSEIGKGSIFTVLIPFEIEASSEQPFNNSLVNNTESSDCDKICFAGKRVLIAEDNEMNSEIICELLKKHKVEVQVAVNGEEAVNMFLSKPENYFDLILMDIQMPILDGYEATKIIRSSQHSQAKTIPIIAMTAYAFAEDVIKSLSAGMNKHLTKPIDIEKVCEMLIESFRK